MVEHIAARTILIVDRDPECFRVLRRACLGVCDVAHAETAAEAFCVLAIRRIDLVVVDHPLPDASGLDLLTKIQSTEPQLPVILTTLHDSEALGASVFQLGARDYFAKPWVAAGLASSVRSILATTEQRRELPNNVVAEQEPTSSPEDEVTARIRRLARLILDGRDTVSFARLAGQLGLSKASLSRRFKRSQGVAYRKYLMNCRVARAQKLLANPRYTVTTIALEVGFGDLPRFDKVFRALTGMSPSTYRKELAKGQQATSDGSEA